MLKACVAKRETRAMVGELQARENHSMGEAGCFRKGSVRQAVK
jgi:hypothetical protein